MEQTESELLALRREKLAALEKLGSHLSARRSKPPAILRTRGRNLPKAQVFASRAGSVHIATWARATLLISKMRADGCRFICRQRNSARKPWKFLSCSIWAISSEWKEPVSRLKRASRR